MLTIRAKLKNGKIIFTDSIAVPLAENQEHEILITFLEAQVKSEFGVTNFEEGDIRIMNLHKLGITSREHEVLLAVEKGSTNEQIAEQLDLGHGTVRNYLSSIYEKLKVENRTGAIAKAKELGLLD